MDNQTERVAKEIYAAMQWGCKNNGGSFAPEWSEGGNSFAQCEARKAARAAIEAMQPAPVTPQQAAKVLLDFLATPSEHSPVPYGTLEKIWRATFRKSGFLAVRGFLAATATETPQ